MPFTEELNLESPSEGQGDWDSSLNANFALLDKGQTFKGTAGLLVGSGVVVIVNNSGYVVPYDARSTGLGRPGGFSRYSVASGATGYFTHVGAVRSMGVTSLSPGQPVFASRDPNSLGVLTTSYGGAANPIGMAIGFQHLHVNPAIGNNLPETFTRVASGASHVSAASAFFFSVDAGNRGYIRKLVVQTASHATLRYKVSLWTASTRATSEYIYDTLTVSLSPYSADVSTSYFEDSAGFPYKSTEASSWSLIFGTIQIQSGHNVASGNFSITLEVERLR